MFGLEHEALAGVLNHSGKNSKSQVTGSSSQLCMESYIILERNTLTMTFIWVSSVTSVHVHINYSCHLAQKYARIFVRGHYLFQEANSFPRAKLKENCELWGTDNVQGQISEHIFIPNGGYCLYYPSNLFCNVCNFQNWGIFSDIPQF